MSTSRHAVWHAAPPAHHPLTVPRCALPPSTRHRWRYLAALFGEVLAANWPHPAAWRVLHKAPTQVSLRDLGVCCNLLVVDGLLEDGEWWWCGLVVESRYGRVAVKTR